MPHKSETLLFRLRWLSALCAAAYLVGQAWQPYPANWRLKGACAGLLAASAFGGSLPVLGIALALSSAGDILLELDPQRLFVYGLGLFLLTHLLYIFLFLRSRPRPFAVGTPQAVFALVLLLYCGAVSAWLMPDLGALKIPVAIYMVVITAMVAAAILTRFSSPAVLWGAVLFLASDSLLAINKFKTPVPYRDSLVWATYYLGQFGIASGLLQERRKQN